MAEPTTALTIANLVTKVAKVAGIAYYGDAGDEKAKVPIDQHDLALCVDTVNDGIRMFIANEPRNGWRWQRRVMVVNLRVQTDSTATGGTSTTLVDSDLAADYDDDYYNNCILEITAGTGKGEHALVTDYTGASGTFTFSALSGGSTPDTTSEYQVGHRYKLSDDFGGTPDGAITYLMDTSHAQDIDWVHEASIRSMQANSPTTGYPYCATIRPYGNRQFELLVYPGPSTADAIVFPYTHYFDGLKLESGEADSGTATTIVDATRLEADDYFNDWIIEVISGTGEGETATVTDFTKSSGTFTFTALSGGSTPDSTTRYIVYESTNTHPAGYQFDDAILAACIARGEIDDIIDPQGWEQRYYQVSLPKAYNKDARLAPRKLGYMGDGTKQAPTRRWNNVTYETD